MPYPYSLPDADKRFLPPPDWYTDQFYNQKTGHHIAFSGLNAPNSSGIVVILPGLSEFAEKYIETAVFLQNNGFSTLIIDWAYQGRSSRFAGNKEKRHSDGYETDLDDLDYLIKNHTDPDLPLFFLCHSMGAHIGIRYLIDVKNTIAAAAFSAPLTCIKSIPDKFFLSAFVRLILAPFKNFYVPKGKNWDSDDRNSEDIFSNDSMRKKIHHTWSKENPDLRLGSPTNKWLIETLKSMRYVKKNIKKYKTPSLIALAQDEDIVCNKETRGLFAKNNNIDIIELKNSKHEILMETDQVRDLFLNKAIALFKKSLPASHPQSK